MNVKMPMTNSKDLPKALQDGVELGVSSVAKLLIVSHCERGRGEIIRIISARKATKQESTFYKGEKK